MLCQFNDYFGEVKQNIGNKPCPRPDRINIVKVSSIYVTLRGLDDDNNDTMSFLTKTFSDFQVSANCLANSYTHRGFDKSNT